jgi:hypothetical protein
MKTEVVTGIDELKRQFAAATFSVREDGQGGAYVVMEPVPIGDRYRPTETWLGFHIPAQYPYADIYPVFMGADVVRAGGQSWVVPVTPGHTFEGRRALQVSRRNGAAQTNTQKAAAKILKVLDFLEKLL